MGNGPSSGLGPSPSKPVAQAQWSRTPTPLKHQPRRARKRCSGSAPGPRASIVTGSPTANSRPHAMHKPSSGDGSHSSGCLRVSGGRFSADTPQLCAEHRAECVCRVLQAASGDALQPLHRHEVAQPAGRPRRDVLARLAGETVVDGHEERVYSGGVFGVGSAAESGGEEFPVGSVVSWSLLGEFPADGASKKLLRKASIASQAVVSDQPSQSMTE